MIPQHLDDGVTPNPQWIKARQGCLGASQISHILDPWTGARKKGQSRDKDSKMRRSLAISLAWERIAAKSAGRANWRNPDIQRGIRLEPVVLRHYEAKRRCWLKPPAWIEHQRIANTGATPDGFHPEGGLVQVKTMKLDLYGQAVQKILDEGIKSLEADHYAQITWEQAVARSWGGGYWTDYVLFCEDAPANKRMHVTRYIAEDSLVKAYEEQAAAFEREVDYIFTLTEENQTFE